MMHAARATRSEGAAVGAQGGGTGPGAAAAEGGRQEQQQQLGGWEDLRGEKKGTEHTLQSLALWLDVCCFILGTIGFVRLCAVNGICNRGEDPAVPSWAALGTVPLISLCCLLCAPMGIALTTTKQNPMTLDILDVSVHGIIGSLLVILSTICFARSPQGRLEGRAVAGWETDALTESAKLYYGDPASLAAAKRTNLEDLGVFSLLGGLCLLGHAAIVLIRLINRMDLG